MVDERGEGEKNSDGAPAVMLVVAGALQDGQGRVMMHQRPCGKMYAGLWEFPGGKVEPYEMPAQSLARELREELGIAADPASVVAAGFAEDGARPGRGPIVLLLYTVQRWSGDPQALEGGQVCWFTPQEALQLAMPPLDRTLAGRLFAGSLTRSG